MDAAEAIIASKLEALRAELSEREERERRYQEERNGEGLFLEEFDLERYEARRRDEDTLVGTRAQVRLLEELKATLHQQHAESKAHFLAIKDRDERSSKQNVWLTVASSAISLILGWLLSLVGSPASVLRVFGH